MIFNKINNYRFPVWITVFLFLLVSIPMSFYFGYYILAKISGVILVCSILIAMKYWFAVSSNRNNVVPRVVLNNNDLFDLSRDFKSFSAFNDETKNIIINRIGLLLAKVKFINTNLTLLERRESIQLAYVYTLENWTDDFIVNLDWIFQLTTDAYAETKYEYVVSIDDLHKKFTDPDILLM